MSSSILSMITTIVLQLTTDKLSKNNHTVWRAQVLATLWGARLEVFIYGKKKAPAEELEEKDDDKKILVPNPEYEDWLVGDQQVLNFILTSVSKILVRITTHETD
jgi:steroid 5-alpha reductase family enzyme